MDTVFFVQPYRLKHRRLVASAASTFEYLDEAVWAGLRAARFRPGVVVLSQQIDTVSGHKGRPTVIAIHGWVPDAWHELSAGLQAA